MHSILCKYFWAHLHCQLGQARFAVVQPTCRFSRCRRFDAEARTTRPPSGRSTLRLFCRVRRHSRARNTVLISHVRTCWRRRAPIRITNLLCAGALFQCGLGDFTDIGSCRRGSSRYRSGHRRAGPVSLLSRAHPTATSAWPSPANPTASGGSGGTYAATWRPPS